MLTENLYKRVLIEPVKSCTDLYIVSGYASWLMVSKHLEGIAEEKNKINIHLIVGMVGQDGISKQNHQKFCDIVQQPNTNFKCNYILENKHRVHTKAYAWFNNKSPVKGFVGSANYTQNAFFRQREAVECSPPEEIWDYFRKLEEDSCSCLLPDVDGLVKDDVKIFPDDEEAAQIEDRGLENVTTTFLDVKGDLPQGSGLNWGQRTTRNHNEAYIPVRAPIGKSKFFPDRGTRFLLHTDDGQCLLCSTNQDNAKAIHSCDNNSLLGEYFRNRLGVPLGAPVKKEHLEKYGRADVTFYKIDDENYLMDFSVSNGA